MISVAVAHAPRQEIDELLPVMLKKRKDFRTLGQRYDVGLDGKTLTDAMAEELVLMTGAATAPFYDKALVRLNISGVALLFVFPKKRGHGDV